MVLKTMVLRNMYRGCFILAALMLSQVCLSFNHLECVQTFEKDSSQVKKWITTGGITALGGTSIVLLNELWYKDYPRSSFHFFNDNREWLQMDKVGHITTTYYLSSILHPWLKWAGYTDRQSLFLGTGISLAYQSAIEILDGHSKEWGFSSMDAFCNLAGAGMYFAQEIYWQEQRLKMKFSYHPSSFASLRPDLLGVNNSQRVLKDYNAQTYWLSANVSSFLSSQSKFPKWLNVAFGYGADGMIGANTNDYSIYSGDRYRQLYLSLDVDLTKIDWPKKWMMTTARILNLIKLPSPTVEFAVNRNFYFFMFK